MAVLLGKDRHSNCVQWVSSGVSSPVSLGTLATGQPADRTFSGGLAYLTAAFPKDPSSVMEVLLVSSLLGWREVHVPRAMAADALVPVKRLLQTKTPH